MIEQMIREMMEEDDVAEIQRNELAGRLHCVPSQINYVLSTRFSPERGYLIESRRGGGGYVRIRRLTLTGPSLLMHTVSTVGDRLEMPVAEALIRNLYQAGELTEREASMLMTMVGDGPLADLPQARRPEARARLFKAGLMALADKNKE